MATKYTVKGGDTLSGIAKKFGVDYHDITGYRSGNPNLIYPNEVLNIPTNSPPQVANKSQAQDYLNKVQNVTYTKHKMSGDGEPKLVDFKFDMKKALKDIKGLLPTTPAPEAPNLVDTWSRLKEDYNVDELEKKINDMTAQEDAIAAQLRINKYNERSKPVATNVIQGRIGEHEFNAREDYDFVARQKDRAVNELKGAYSAINTIMQLTQQDFDNARAVYKDQFDRAYKAISLAQGERDFAFNEYKQAQARAAANAQVMVNAIKNGNMDLKNMPEDMRVQLNRLEIQAGLPMGFFENLKMDADAQIVATSNNNGQIQVLMRDGDGNLKLQKYGTPNPSATSLKAQEKADAKEAVKEFDIALGNVKGQDGYVSPSDYRKVAAQWVRTTGNTFDDFNKYFKKYANPSHYYDYIPDRSGGMSADAQLQQLLGY